MDSIKTNISELLSALTSGDSATILTAFAATMFFGWAMGYFWNNLKIKALKATNDKIAKENEHYKGLITSWQEKHALQEADLKKAELSLSEKTASLETADAERRTLNSRLNATLVDLDTSKEEFQEATNKMEDLNDQILGLRTKNLQLSTEIEQKATIAGNYAISQELSSTENDKKIADLAAENSLLKNSMSTLKAGAVAEGTAGATLRISELETENEALKTQIETTPTPDEIAAEASEEVAALRSRLVELEAEKEKLAASYAEIAQLEAGNEALNMSIQSLIEENDELQKNTAAISQYESGNEVLNTTISTLLAEKEALEQQIAENGNTQMNLAVKENTSSTALNLVDTDLTDSEELDVETAKANFRAIIGEQIPMAASEDRDDLKQINGIGPFIEEKLNDLGIYTFEQVSALDEDMVNTLTTAIEFFPGRIERDDWVGQADRLFYTRGNTPQNMTNTSAKIITRRYATATEKIEVNTDATANLARSSVENIKPDDLKKIEGIGPKIASILNDAGITTFSKLSQSPADELKSILAAAGNRFKLHDPTTWPEQATLAAAGEWDRLKQLQDQLDGGRNVAKG